MATWAIRRRQGRERIEKAIALLWLFNGLRLLTDALANEHGPLLLMNLLVTVLLLAIMSPALKRGERPARLWLGGAAMLGIVLNLEDTLELDATFQLLVGWPVMLGLIAICVLIFDERKIAFYLREQALHAQYLRQRRQRQTS